MLEEAFQRQAASEEYTAFKATGVHIEGVYDDHDYGVNDAGVHLPSKAASQQLYLDFLNVAKDSPRRSRNGLYSAHLFGAVNGGGVSGADASGSSSSDHTTATSNDNKINNNKPQLLVIFLDTRSHRESHAIPSIAEKEWLPLSAPLAAAIRLASVLVGYGEDHEGDMLGDEQWCWLESVLEGSTADATVIVTSVQL